MSYAPKPGTAGYERVVARGCGGNRDHFGGFDCDHAYPWTCDDCPWLTEHQRNSAESLEHGRRKFFASVAFD